MNCKGWWKKYYRYSPGCIEKNHEKLQDNRYLGRDLNRISPEYNSEALPPELTCSLWDFCSNQFCKGRRPNNNVERICTCLPFDNENWRVITTRQNIFQYYERIIYLWLYSPLLGLDRFFSFLIFYTFSMTPWTGISPSQDRYLHTGEHKHRINTQ
jgi:hypothetical protein